MRCFLLAAWAAASLSCSARRSAEKPAPAAAPRAPAPVAKPASPEPDLFASTVKPMLERRCGECHAPGGKMYDRLPFDSPDVVASHKDGILRRLKVAEERQILEEWTKQRAAPVR
jgi:hypothetical protein